MARPVSGWLAALEAIMTLEADVFVPGDGPISTRKQLQALHDCKSWLTATVSAHQSAGHGPLEIAKRLTRTPGFAPFRAWESPERLYINVATIVRQLHGEGPMPTDPITRAKAFDGVACLCRHLESVR